MIFPLRSIILLICVSHAIIDGALGEAELSRHPYVQMTTQGSVAILWRTVGGSIPIVRYGLAPDGLSDEVLPVQIVVRLGPDVQGPVALPRLHSAPAETYQYEASVFGLEAGTVYYYGIYDGDRLLAGGDIEHSFTTLPAAGSAGPLRLWVVGDSGDGSLAQKAGFQAMRDFVANDGKAIDAFLHLGDMAYGTGRDDEFSENFFEIYTDLLRNTVVWPTMGNHEGVNSSGVTQSGPYYDAYAVPTEGEAGGEPSGTEAYYSFDIGRVHFICLNSHDLDRTTTGDMALWLKSDLEMVDADWLVAFWHHPPYTKGSHDSDRENQLIQMREFILPILESSGVDLVLAGHSHIYERSMLIDGAYATPTTTDGVVLDDGDGDPAGHGAYRKSAALNPNEGTVAIVAGNGRSGYSRYGVSPVMRSIVTEVGSVVLDIDGDTLTGRMINSVGVVRDQFQLIKQGVVTPSVLEFPWQPTGPGFLVERPAPGETLVEILAVPPAPDAVIYFTLDGSQPTLDSPIYTGPIRVSDVDVVRAFSVWRGGDRTSPTATAAGLPPAVSIRRYLSTAGDDGREDVEGIVDLDAETLPIGADALVGLRFDDLRIPKGSYAVSASVQFQKARQESFITAGSIWAELAADSLPFSREQSDFSSRPRTLSFASWSPQSWYGTVLRGPQTTTPNLSDMINEVTGQPDWQPGNALSLFLAQSGIRTAEAFEAGRERSAALSITYIEPDGLGEALAAGGVWVDEFEPGRYAVVLRWPLPSAAEAFGLSYQFEMSPDLVDWEPFDSVDEGFSALAADGFGELYAEINPQVLAGRNRYYFRATVHQGGQNP